MFYMEMASVSPRFLSVYSAEPVRVKASLASEPLALGVSTLCDSSLQRLTWMSGEGRANSLLATEAIQQPLQLWGMALYSEVAPLEAVEIQPYSRPQRGVPSLFLMQGDLPGIADNERFPVGEQWPLSCTDQERAFCLLQERIRKLWSEGRPDAEMRLALIADYAGRLHRLGPHSFIYSDGEFLFAYSALEGSEEPLAFIQENSALSRLTGEVLLDVNAEACCRRLIIGSRSLLPEGAEVIGPGSTLCFSQGQLLERCDPVDFWAGSAE